MTIRALQSGAHRARRSLGALRRLLQQFPSRIAAKMRCSFITAPPPAGNAFFRSAWPTATASLMALHHGLAGTLRLQSESALSHRFDLLGSGPTVVMHGTKCRGVAGTPFAHGLSLKPDHEGHWLVDRINAANLPEARRLWSLVDEDYTPIDWQLDFKSGYRWSESCWYRDIRITPRIGADVKIPWELARCQHLPALALACHFAACGEPGFHGIEKLAREIRNQILDFIATNPPGFGVNWACTMDVAIRAANFILARDIALASGAVFDAEFEAALAGSMVAHGRHIVANLEWDTRWRGNHYLANIAGLSFISAWLPRNPEVDAWLAFATQEVLAEVCYQFHQDGSNFEGSVCYHRLSAEIVLWTAALLAGLPATRLEALEQPQFHHTLPRLQKQPLTLFRLPWGNGVSPLPGWFWQRLSGMAAFTRAVTRPDGLVVQFGDNDSGRFISVGSSEQLRVGNGPATAAWSLDHSALTSGIDALLGAPPTDPYAWLLCRLAGPVKSDSQSPSRQTSTTVVAHRPDEKVWAEAGRLRDQAHSAWTCRFTVPDRPDMAQDQSGVSTAGLANGLRLFAFPGAGCYIFRSPRLFLAIRCGEIGLAGLGAHAHCDQLAIELVIDGKTLVRDPGTYIYTALPEKRNIYRSAKVHHVPRIAGLEPANLERHLFDLRDLAPGKCLYFGPLGFFGSHNGYGPPVYRQIVIEEEAVLVHDFAEHNIVLTDPTPEPIAFSHAYGRLLDPAP